MKIGNRVISSADELDLEVVKATRRMLSDCSERGGEKLQAAQTALAELQADIEGRVKVQR